MNGTLTVTAKTTPGGKLAIRGEAADAKAKTVYSSCTGYPYLLVKAIVDENPYNPATGWFDGERTVALKIIKRSRDRAVVARAARLHPAGPGNLFLLTKYGAGEYSVKETL